MGNKRVVGEGSQIRNAGKSKWFARLMLLATGLVLSVGGVLSAVHFINTGSDECAEYTYATSANAQSATISGNTLNWNSSTGSNTGNREVWLARRNANGTWSRVGLLGRNTRADTETVWSGDDSSTRTLWSPPAAHYLLPGATGASWTDNSSRSGSINLAGLTAHLGVGQHTLRVEIVERRFGGSGGGYNLNGARQNFGQGFNTMWLAGATLTWSRTETLGTPGNVRMVGDTLHWNAVANANGYRVYRGTTHIANAGNVTSLNLSGHSGNGAGSQHTFSVSATSTAAYRLTSARGGAATWGQLATPSNLRMSGTTLNWNAVGSATGYRIYRGGAHIHTLGAVTSFNLAGHGHGNFSVRAVSSAATWGDSGISANLAWGQIGTPTGVAVAGSNLNWTGVANATHYRIYSRRLDAGDWRFAVQVAHAGAATASQTFNLTNWANTYDRYGAIIGAGDNNQIRVVGVNTTAGTLWDRSANSSAVTFGRVGQVHTIAITSNINNIAGGQTLAVGWPRPRAVNEMPTGQLSANVTQVYGTNTGVTWASDNPSIVSVDALSGAIRAGWPEGMASWELCQRPTLTTRITARTSVGQVVAEIIIHVTFSDVPAPIAVGVNVSGGEREFTLAPCGTSLVGGASLRYAAQFVGVAYGYNLGASTGVTWASSDTSVATIDAQGRLTVRGEGVATIVATSITAPNVPYAFEIVVVRDGTSVATGVSVYCEQNTSTERRLVIPYDVSDLPFVDLRAHIDGHNITSQLVTWTSSCGAMLGSPSMFLEFSLTENGLRVTGLLQGGPFIITATPVGAIGAVGTFRIFVDQSVAAVVTSVSVSAPSVSELVVPNTRPLLTPDFPTTQLTATTVGGVGGGTNSAVVWTSSCGARAGVGIESIVGEFVYFILDGTNPNSVSVRARDRGLAGFSQAVTITATSVVTPSQFASRQITVSQGAISGIEVSAVAGGLSEGTLIIPYASSEVAGRPTIDLQALVSVSHASVSGAIRWVVCTPNVVALYNIRNTEPLTSVVTLRPLDAGVFTIWAVGVYCGVESSIFTLTIEQEGATSVRISGRNEGVFSYEMHIRLPRPDAIHLPMVELIAWVGGRPAASGVAWTSSCGGEIVEFLGSAGVLVTLRAVNAGTAIIRATNNSNGFYSTFTISVTKASLDSVEILGDGVVRQQTAMLIPLEYNDGVYTLSDVAVRQILTLSLNVATSGDVTTQFVWTISDSSVIRINGAEVCAETGEVTSSKITDIGGFVQVLPYGVGVATIRAVSTIDASFYTEFTIFVTRGTASCIIQDGILDLPQIQDGYVRIILVCEHYFGQRRMTHVDMHFADAMYYILPMLQINIEGAIFHGWSLSRGGQLLGATFVANGGSNGGSEEYNGEGYEGGYTNGGGTNGGEYVILIPMHLFDLEAGLDTLLLFAVWYIPYVPSENGGSNLARNIIIGTLSVAGVGAAGTAGYVAQSKIRARRKNDMEEWGLDN